MPVVNPDGTPGNVAPDELIESAWGNATADTFTKLKVLTTLLQAQAAAEVTVFSGGTLVPIGSVTIASAGNYLVLGSATIINRGASGIAQASVQLRVNGANIGQSAIAWLPTPAEAVTVPLYGIANLPAGARTLDMLGVGASGTPAVGTRQIVIVRVL